MQRNGIRAMRHTHKKSTSLIKAEMNAHYNVTYRYRTFESFRIDE